MTARYRLEPGEEPRAEVPTRCPWGGDGQACHVVVDHFRPRKTGPCFPVLVGRCRVHGHGFTVYPPGHVPYGRQAVAPADLGGDVLLGGDGEADGRTPAWGQTIFGATTDAAGGRLWDMSSPSKDEWRRRTQGRWLELGAKLLGLAEVGESAREQLAERLGLDCLDVIEEARAYRAAVGLRGRGRVIARALDKLPVRRCLCDDLLVCGAIAGLWGRPSRWDPGGPTGGVLVAF